MVARAVRILATLTLLVIVVAAVAWAAMAIWFDGPHLRVIAAPMAAGLVIVCIILAAIVRPLLRGLTVALFPVIIVALWWTAIPASNARDWTFRRRPHGARNFSRQQCDDRECAKFQISLRNDYDQRWETRTYDLARIKGVDLFLSFWGPTEIAHTIVSWDFDDGQHLAISIETRKQKGESYSAIRGFFRQYELYYVVADERDLIGLRTNYRGEQVYLYRIRATAPQARALLVDYLEEVNHLADHPEWYNALTQNCTTTIRGHAQNVGVGGNLDWRLLANGHLDELLYERGQIDTSIPFAELRARSNITEKAKAAGDSPDFSARIRQGLPGISG